MRRSRSAFLWAITAAAIVVLALVASWRRDRVDRAPAKSVAARDAAPSIPARRGVATPELRTSESGPETADLSRDSAAEHVPTGLPHRLDGAVRVLDLAGEPIPVHSGSIVWDQGGAKPLRTAIERSCWFLEPVLTRFPRIADAEIRSGSKHYPVVPLVDTLAARSAQGQVLEFSLIAGAQLNAVDARSGVHLEDVEVATIHAWAGEYRDTYQSPPEPFAAKDCLLRGDSPLPLPSRLGTIAGWVRAPGYAWSRFAFDAASKSITVALERGADLIVELRGHDPRNERAALLVYGAGAGAELGEAHHAPLAAALVGRRSRVELRGLPGGPVLVALVPSLRTEFLGPRLAQRWVVLELGASTTLELDLRDASSREGLCRLEVRMARELFESGADGATLCVALAGGGELGHDSGVGVRTSLATLVDETPGAVVVEHAGVASGEYAITLLPHGIHVREALLPNESTIVELGVVPMGSVELTVLTPDGHPARRAEIVARPGPSPGVGPWREIGTTNAEGELAFRWPVGPASIYARGTGGQEQVRVLDVLAGATTDVVLRYERSGGECVIGVSIARSGEEVLLPSAFWNAVDARAIDDSGGELSARRSRGGAQSGSLTGSWSARGVTLHVTEPGEYEVTFPTCPGVPSIPPHRVRAKPDVEVPLVVAW